MKQEKFVSATKSLLASSYDLNSDGIPPHTYMLECIVNGMALNGYSKETFQSAHKSNLLFIPGLTVYFDERDRNRAISYFGEEKERSIQGKKEATRGLAERIATAHIRYFFNPEKEISFDEISTEELQQLINEFKDKGILSKLPSPVSKWISAAPYLSLSGLVIAIGLNNKGRFTETGLDWFKSSYDILLKEPLYSIGVSMHIQKLDVMLQIFDCTIDKAKVLGFADVNGFNPETYFNPPHDNSKKEKWQESFQQFLNRDVPSPVELSKWAHEVLESTKEKYGSIELVFS